MIKEYTGALGCGKSYHALEDIIKALNKGLYVIANFPLNFTPRQVRMGWHNRFMYMQDNYLMGVEGIRLLMQTSINMGWLDSNKEGLCQVFVDESTNFFPKEDATKPEQKLWKTFLTQSRKFSYDFTLIHQDSNSINKTISKCIEYEVKHRKANNIFPFSLFSIFNITLFIHITFWKQQRTRLKSGSTFFVKRLSEMYQHKKLFANLDEQLDKFLKTIPESNLIGFQNAYFGNSSPAGVLGDGGQGKPVGEAPTVAATEPIEEVENIA